MDPVSVLAFGLPGGMEWIIVLVIGLLLFGRRLPEIMRGLGGGVREFRKGIEGEADESKSEPEVKRQERVEQAGSGATDATSAEGERAGDEKHPS